MRQTLVGLALALCIIAAWFTVHVYGVFVADPGIGTAPLVLLQCWLNVGLFIIAHDCMHGSLAPGRTGINTAVGVISVALYAGFTFSRLYEKHHDHHRFAGTKRDPDFGAGYPRRFLPWYLNFIRKYFGLREFTLLTLALAIYLFVFGASLSNMLMFWALPAVLSSLQLFVFGTYLPHRHTDEPFVDAHRARSSDFSWLVSLLTCFHFGGYHHEHHTHPRSPWWRLPAVRSGRG